MRTLMGMARYLVLIAVIGLLLAALAVFVFGGISTVTILVEAFQHGEYGAEGARILSVEIVEMIDLFLLGTVLLITAVGLYQLFIDPHIELPEWLSVGGLEELKKNLMAVIIVMLVVMFLGAVAGIELEGGEGLLGYGAAIALVIGASSLAIYTFAQVEQGAHEMEQAEAHETLESGDRGTTELSVPHVE